MQIDDYIQFWIPAIRNLWDFPKDWGSIDSYGWRTACFDMEDALGLPVFGSYDSQPASEDFPMSEELKQLLTRLAGPHGKTLFKVLQIRAQGSSVRRAHVVS